MATKIQGLNGRLVVEDNNAEPDRPLEDGTQLAYFLMAHVPAPTLKVMFARLKADWGAWWSELARER